MPCFIYNNLSLNQIQVFRLSYVKYNLYHSLVEEGISAADHKNYGTEQQRPIKRTRHIGQDDPTVPPPLKYQLQTPLQVIVLCLHVIDTNLH